MKKPIYILGTGLSHDGSSCLMKDGKIVVAIEKERLTKIKHDGFNDDSTILYCLDAEGISFKDVSLVVEKNTINPFLKSDDIEKRGRRIIPSDVPTVKISHHLAHAYSAVGPSPFKEMGVIVMDGQGSDLLSCTEEGSKNILPPEIQNIKEKEKYLYWEKESYYMFENGKLTPVFKDYSKYCKWDRFQYPIAPFDMENSIAGFYAGVSYYIFNEYFCEGKLMGLSPYGKQNAFNFNAFTFKDGRVFLNYDWMKNIDPYLGGKYQSFFEYFQYYADLAYWAQKEIEKAIFYLFNTYYSMHPQKNVGYVGGLALNAVANAKLFTNTRFERFYFQPAAGDNGLAIGCCYYGWIEELKKEKILHNGSIYFGKKYTFDEILEEFQDKLEIKESNHFIEEAAGLLAEGKIIAWFQGGSEFGPRALGNRSILADPRRRDTKNFINRKVKSREDFRPFAPSVLIEDVSVYFEGAYESPYMILVDKMKPEWIEKLPAVVHKDSSARVQTVSKEFNSDYYALITAFKKLTGISILLNTSFNDRGMPIIETPQEAIHFFLKVKTLDALIIKNFIIKQKNIPLASKTIYKKNRLKLTTPTLNLKPLSEISKSSKE